MADLNSRVESFITMLLDVSGRARPVDLDAHVATGADELLQAYAAAHGEMNLAFEGDMLVLHASPQPVAQPEPAPEPAPIEAEALVPLEEPATVPEPGVASPGFDVSAIPEVVPEPQRPAAAVEPVAVEPAPFVFDPSTLPEVVVPEPEAVVTVGSDDAGPQVAEPPAIQIPEVAAVQPLVEASTLPGIPSEPVMPSSAAEPMSIGLDPATPSAPVIPVADDSSFFEFDSVPVADVPSAAADVPAEPELVFVPLAPVDEDEFEAAAEPPAPMPLPDLSDLPELPELPVIETPTPTMPEIIPGDPLEGLDDSDGF